MRIPEGKYPIQQWLDAWEVMAAQVAMETGTFVEVGKEYTIQQMTNTIPSLTPYYISIGSGCSGTYSTPITTTTTIPNTISGGLTTTSGSAGTNVYGGTMSIQCNTYYNGSPYTPYTTSTTSSWTTTNLIRIFFKWENMEFETLPALRRALEMKAFV